MSVESMIWSLRFVDLPPREKLVLIGIASHDGDGGAWPSEATLADYAGCTTRQVRRLIATLADRGFVTVHVNSGGTTKTRGDRRPNLYELHRPEITIPASRVDISVTTGGHFEHERVDIAVSTESSSETPSESSASSSLRSEGSTESSMSGEDAKVAKIAPEHQKIAQEFWDWHVAENGGPPAQQFTKLMAVAKAALKREYPADEILDAMKMERRSVTAASVINRIGFERRAREDRPSTAAIPSAVVKAMVEARPWFEQRWPGLPKDRNWSVMVQDVARLVKMGYGIGESMIRLAVGMRRSDFGSAFWLLNIDIPRFNGALADVPGSMEIAFRNRGWKL